MVFSRDFIKKSHFSQKLSIFRCSRCHFRKRLIKSKKKTKNFVCLSPQRNNILFHPPSRWKKTKRSKKGKPPAPTPPQIIRNSEIKLPSPACDCREPLRPLMVESFDVDIWHPIRCDFHEKSWPRKRKQIARTYFTQQSKSNISRPPTHNPLCFLSTSTSSSMKKRKEGNLQKSPASDYIDRGRKMRKGGGPTNGHATSDGQTKTTRSISRRSTQM